MSIVKDAFSDILPFKKKPKESEEEMVNRLENDLKEYRKKMEEKNKMSKEIKVEKPKQEEKEEKELPPEFQEEDIDRLAILEQNVLTILQDFNERLSNIEQYLVAKK